MSQLPDNGQRQEQILEALHTATRPWQPWPITFWDAGRACSGPVARGGIPPTTALVASTADLADSLREYADSYIGPKDAGPLLLTYSTHIDPARGGHSNEDCKSVTGLVLDCDTPDPRNAALAAQFLQHLQDKRLAYICSYKHSTHKFHIVLPIVARVVPRDGEGKVLEHAPRIHQRLFLHCIENLQRLAGVLFDPAMASGLMRIEYPATRKTADEAMPELAADGIDSPYILDLDAFAAATGFLTPKLAPTARKRALAKDVEIPTDTRTEAEIVAAARAALAQITTTPHLLAKMGGNLPESARAVLRGLPYATKGRRDQTLMDLTNAVGMALPFAPSEWLVKVFLPSLEATASQGDAPTEDKLWHGITRGQEYGRNRALEDRILMAALTRSIRESTRESTRESKKDIALPKK